MTDTIYPTHPTVPASPAANPYLVQQIGTPVPTAYPMPQLPQNGQAVPQAQPQVAPQAAAQAAPQAYVPQQPAHQEPVLQQAAPQQPSQPSADPDSFLEDVTWSNFSGAIEPAQQDLSPAQPQPAQPAPYEPQAYNQGQDTNAAQMMPSTAFPPMPPLIAGGAMAAMNGGPVFTNPNMQPSLDVADQDDQAGKTGPSKSLLSRFKRTPKLKTEKVKTPKVKTPKVKSPKVKLPKLKRPKVELPNVEQPNLAMPNVAMPNVGMPSVGMPSVGMPNIAPHLQSNSQMDMPARDAIPQSEDNPRKSFLVPFLVGLLSGVILTVIALNVLGGAAEQKEYGVVAKSGQVPAAEAQLPVSAPASDVTAQAGNENDTAFLDAQLSSN